MQGCQLVIRFAGPAWPALALPPTIYESLLIVGRAATRNGTVMDAYCCRQAMRCDTMSARRLTVRVIPQELAPRSEGSSGNILRRGVNHTALENTKKIVKDNKRIIRSGTFEGALTDEYSTTNIGKIFKCVQEEYISHSTEEHASRE